MTVTTSCLFILSQSLKAAVKLDLPEPAVPMINTSGIVKFLLLCWLYGLSVLTVFVGALKSIDVSFF